MLAAVVAALIVPFGFARSNESSDHASVAVARAAVPVSDLVTPTTPLFATGTVMALPQVPEGAKLLAIGTALFALAGAMRRSS